MAQYNKLPVEDYPEIAVHPSAVVHNGLIITCLNAQLIARNGVSPKGVELLKQLHRQMFDLYQKMENTDDISELRTFAQEVTKIEFAQQNAWKFFQDEKKHLWFDVPKCSCPKIDNMERIGTPFRIYSGECPIHGVDYDPNVPEHSQRMTDHFHNKAVRKLNEDS